MKTSPRTLIAAGIGGAVGTGLDVSTLMLLVKQVGLHVPLAAFIAATVGAVACFVLNKYVAFRDRTPVRLSQVGRFGVMAIGAAVLMAAAMKLIAVDLGVPVFTAKLICAAAVFAVWTYPAQRWIVFRRAAAPVPA